jgi:predicted Zn-dependent protease with MMP-like domain
VIVVSEAEFEELVADALDAIPDELYNLLDNVVVTVEDRHPTEQLLGLYEGVPLTERDAYGYGEFPDRITVYRLPTCADAASREEVVEIVRVTVVHEVAHHFGIDDDQLDDLGWA